MKKQVLSGTKCHSSKVTRQQVYHQCWPVKAMLTCRCVMAHLGSEPCLTPLKRSQWPFSCFSYTPFEFFTHSYVWIYQSGSPPSELTFPIAPPHRLRMSFNTEFHYSEALLRTVYSFSLRHSSSSPAAPVAEDRGSCRFCLFNRFSHP